MTNNFGEIIHKLLDITCEKNFRLANYLGYDVTYISKWINGSKLPSQKNITEIIDGICQFFMDNINESSLRQLCYDFELINNSKESVKNELSRYLYDSYESQKLNKNKDYIINNNNSCTMLGNNDIDKWIFENLKNYCNKSKEKDIHIIITHDIKRYSSKKSVSEISKNKDFVFNSKKVYIHQLINLDEMKKDINEYCKIILLYLNSNSNITYNLYSNNNENFNMILVKNCLSVMYINDNNCNLNINSVSRDLETINNLYNHYNNYLSSKVQLYEIKSGQELMDQKYLINFVMQNHIKLIFKNMHSIGIPEDILSKIRHDNNLSSDNLNKVFSMMNVCLQNMKLKIIIYKSALLNYIFDGILNLYDKIVLVSKEDRVCHLQNIINILKTNELFEIRFIEDDNDFISISDLDNSIFISNQSCFTLKDDAKDSLYFKFINKDIIINFNTFFDNIFNSSAEYSTREDVITFIEKGIELLTNK